MFQWIQVVPAVRRLDKSHPRTKFRTNSWTRLRPQVAGWETPWGGRFTWNPILEHANSGFVTALTLPLVVCFFDDPIRCFCADEEDAIIPRKRF